MMENFLLNCFPVAYQIKKLWPTEQQVIVVDWLAQEATSFQTQAKYPILESIKGWRNRECYEAVQAHDWTSSLCQG